jgi:hypothetical protein
VDSAIVDRSAFHGQENSIYLPYRRRNFFYGEYDWICKKRGIVQRAKKTTFKRAFKLLKENKLKNDSISIKFNQGKGSFDRCEICHNAEQLLTRKKWSSKQVEIIKTYRRLHIEQQFAERVTLQSNIAKTYEYDSNGQPTSCLFFSDGFSAWKGNTPKKGSRHSKGDTNHITSRVIGVEVHCGPIHGTMLYYTDNLTSGGANIIIEVMRQSILDLQILLQKKKDFCDNPLDVPDHLFLQFDNCSENKNRYVFAYIALLVQEGHFKVVEVFFLIVGHTHASIDQYFSILATAIWLCEFIGSPLALEALLSKKGGGNLSGCEWDNAGEIQQDLKAAPLLVKKISVVYDMKKALTPLINFKLKYFSLPYRFKFEMYYACCAMQYSMFSTHKVLLPQRPELVPDLDITESLDCAIEFLSLVGGEKDFLATCGVSDKQTLSTKHQNSLTVSEFFISFLM